MTKITRVNGNPEFQALMTYEEDQQKIFNSRMKSSFNQGLECGIERGKKENSIEIGKSMKDKDIDIETIRDCTGLSVEEIEKL